MHWAGKKGRNLMIWVHFSLGFSVSKSPLSTGFRNRREFGGISSPQPWPTLPQGNRTPSGFHTILILQLVTLSTTIPQDSCTAPNLNQGGGAPPIQIGGRAALEGEFTNRLPPILKPHEAASDRGGVPLPPRGVHPAIELAGCTAGLRPPGLEPPWRVVEAGPGKVRERRAGIHKFLGLLSAVPNRHNTKLDRLELSFQSNPKHAFNQVSG